MKKVTMIFIIIFITGVSGLLFAQDLSHLTLIAHYPLSFDANDATSNYDPAHLINTPFQGGQEGGVYCTGNYAYDGTPDSSDILTPPITGLLASAFAISVEFKVTEYMVPCRPIIVCGDLWRWVAAWVQADSTVGIYWEDGWPAETTVKYIPHTWHKVTIVYDSTGAGIGKAYLDGVLTDSTAGLKLDLHDDKRITISHGGSGNSFKGYIRNIKVYSISDPNIVFSNNSSHPKEFNLSQNYPNPFNPETNIQYSLPHAGFVKLAIYNIKGQKVSQLINKFQTAGHHTLTWNGTNLHGVRVSSGIYICRIQSGSQILTQKMVLKR